MSLTDQLRDRLLPLVMLGCLLSASGSTGYAQHRVHALYRSDMPPGAIGAAQAAQSADRAGYVQPVRVSVPKGAVLSLACDGEFPLATTDLRAGLLLGQPYRLRISNIPQFEDQALYPSLEIIDRLHPPKGQTNRFPIPVEITQDDLELALRGSMVVRVIYLENPNEAFPQADDDHQRYLDVLPSEDPLHVADELGRPMAILRLGSRVPLNSEIDSAFLFGSPPVEWLSDRTEEVEYGSQIITESDDFVAPVIESPRALAPKLTVPDVQKLPTQPDAQIPEADLNDPFIDDQSN